MINPNVTGLSFAVAELDENASGHPDQTIDEMRERVAREIAAQMDRAGMSRRLRGRPDIDVALVVHGASPFTVEQHGAAILALVRRDDFS